MGLDSSPMWYAWIADGLAAWLIVSKVAALSGTTRRHFVRSIRLKDGSAVILAGLASPPEVASVTCRNENPTVDFAQLSQMRPLSGLCIGHRQDELDKTFPLLMGRCVGLATRCRKPQSPGFTLRTCVKDRYADFQAPVGAVFFGCCPVNGQAPGRLDRVRRCTTIAKVPSNRLDNSNRGKFAVSGKDFGSMSETNC
jgi:hypothetical protein